MKLKQMLVCCLLIFCCLRPVFADHVSPHQARQYAYIGGYGGIFGFRVKSDGSLLPIQTKPLAKVFLDQLLVDTRTRTVFGITADDKLYCYAVGPTGRLALKSVIPFDVDFRTAVIDPQTHYLYAADGEHSVVVYDTSDPAHLVRRQNIAAPIVIQGVVDQASRLLLLWGHRHTVGQGSSVLLRYPLHPRSPSAHNKAMLTLLQQGINTLASAGPYFVAGNENITLTVYSMSVKSVQALDHKPLLEADAAHLPASIMYCRAGSFLYISTYYGAGSAQAAQPVSAIVVCHLGSGGQLGPQKEVGKPVSNPRLRLDNTEHFLYAVGEEGSIDSYKILCNGQLAFTARIQVPMPSGLVFIKL